MLAYGTSREAAVAAANALAFRVIADRLEHGEALLKVADVVFRAA